MSAATTPDAPLVRTYPLPAPDNDPRFTFGLIHEIAKTLESHGYPALTGMDAVDLMQALFRLLYTTPDTADQEEHLREVAATDADMARGAAIDACVESTGHLPGHYDADSGAR